MRWGRGWRSGAWLWMLLLVASPPAREGRAGTLAVTNGAASSGSFGLEVTVGQTCVQDDVVISGGTFQGDTLACNTITAGNVQIVSPGATFTAGNSIILQNGFSVDLGADFTGAVDPFVTSDFAYVQDDSPTAEKTYNASFQLRLDSLSLDGVADLDHFNGYSSNGDVQFRVVLRHNATLNEDRLKLLARLDGGTFAETTEQVLPAGYNTIRVSWKAGAGDGEFLVSINGAPLSGLTNLSNGAGQIDFVRWGAVDGTLASTTGSMDLDDFSSTDTVGNEVKLTAFDFDVLDQFGWAVAVDGDTVVVGSPFDDNANGTNAGSAYVYRQSGGTWAFEQKLTANDGAGDDEYGRAVAVKRDLLVVGARFNDEKGTDAGAAYLYRFNPATSMWELETKLLAAELDGAERFGTSVAIGIAVPEDSTSGEELFDVIVGSPLSADPLYDGGGAVFLFELSPDGSVWNELGKFTDGDETNTTVGWLGSHVAMSGDLILAGAPQFPELGSNAGAAFLFRRQGSLNAWSLQQKLLPGNPGDDRASYRFGSVVALDGGVAVVGAPGANFSTGAVYAFDNLITGPSEQILTANDAASGDEFGNAVGVSLASSTLLVGAPKDDDDGDRSGSAYVFRTDGSTWSQYQKITASDAADTDEFGWAGAISATDLVLGAYVEERPLTAYERGAAYVFNTSIFADGFESGDTSAWSGQVP